MANEHVLIVDDEKAIQKALRGVLEDEGYRVSAVGTGADALKAVTDELPDVVFLDIWMPRMDGLETLAELKRLRPDATVVMISGHGTIETAVKATRLGAYDFIEKPLSLEKTLITLTRALEHGRLERENAALRARLDVRTEIIGESAPMRALREAIATAAPSSGRVLIHGENGSGKELVARAIHALSGRRDGPFVEVNCAAIPEDLIESELFGHVKGAFTGAVANKLGKFQAADGGTLFLDEIGEMPIELQVKLLRAIQERIVFRVGDTRAENVDIRILAATNRELEKEIAAGRFREDLYYRLNVVNVELPPLRVRGEDVLVIARYLLSRYAREYDSKVKGLSPNAAVAIRKHNWPGNIRELENRIKKAIVLCDSTVIGPDDLGLTPDVLPQILTLSDAKDKFQRDYINEVLALNNGNRTKTARDLGVDPRTIFRYLEKEQNPMPSGAGGVARDPNS
ncbi:MAG: sigma-54-dependent transcriptional regulator [Gaiellaceae bacterium]